MIDIAFVPIPIEQQRWVEVEVDRPKSLFSRRSSATKRERQLQSQSQTFWHTFFGAEVPYLTDFLSIYHESDGPAQREAILQDALGEQLRFLRTVAQFSVEGFTLELRYLFWPAQQKVEIAFICKAVGHSEQEAHQKINRLWHHFAANYPDQVYGLAPINSANRLNDLLHYQAQTVTEFRRHEKLVSLDNRNSGYLVYPIQSTLDALNKLWQKLLQQPNPCLLSICLRPTRLTPVEENHLRAIITACRKLEGIGPSGYNISARDIANIYTHYWEQFQSPFLFRLSVASPRPIQPSLLSYLATSLAHPFQAGAHQSQVMHNEPGYFIEPKNQPEYSLAQTNLRHLELVQWGQKNLSPPFPRLPQLIGLTAAHSGFRIPIPPTQGLPGIESRSLVVIDKPNLNVVGDRNIIGDIHIHGPVEGTIVIGGDIVGFGE